MREAEKGQGAMPLAGLGAAPQAGYGAAAPSFPHREAIKDKSSQGAKRYLTVGVALSPSEAQGRAVIPVTAPFFLHRC